MKKKRSKRPGSKNKSKATIMTPVAEFSPNDTIEHYNAVMIEDIRSTVKLLSEGMTTLRSELKSEITSLRTEMNGRFDVVEAAIRCNADNIRELQTDMKVVKADIKELQEDMREVKTSLSRIEPLVDNHGERLSMLETPQA